MNNKLRKILLGLSFVAHTSLKAQVEKLTDTVPSLHVAVGYNKTSNLIFPADIKSVDRGSSSIVVQKAAGIEHILQLKADRLNFPETNLTVVTSDGGFYSFLVSFSPDPPVINLSLNKTYPDSHKVAANGEIGNPFSGNTVYTMTAREVKSKSPFMSIHSERQKILFSLQKIFLKDGLMWFGLKVKNRSFVDYRPEYLRFFTKDINRLNRTAQQEVDIAPVFTDLSSVFRGKKNTLIVFACHPFTIAPSQELDIQVGEKRGGRTVKLRVRYTALLKARLLK